MPLVPARRCYNMVQVGDVVRLKESLYPYTQPKPDLGIVVDWMPPFAKTLEPYGLYRVVWSGDMEHLNFSDDLSDDLWLHPEDLEIIITST